MSRSNQEWNDVVYDDSYRHISKLIGMDLDEYMRLRAEHAQNVADDRARRIVKAVALSPTVHICDALLRGEQVPGQALDFFAAQRYGLRPGVPEGVDRFTLADFNDVPQ